MLLHSLSNPVSSLFHPQNITVNTPLPSPSPSPGHLYPNTTQTKQKNITHQNKNLSNDLAKYTKKNMRSGY